MPRRRASRPALAALATISAIALAAPVGPRSLAGSSSSIGDPFYPELGDPRIDVQAYAIDLSWRPPSPEHPSGVAAVTTVIDALAVEDIDQVALDLARAHSELERVQVDGIDVKPGGDPDGQKLLLALPSPVRVGSAFRVRVTALTEPSTLAKTGSGTDPTEPAADIDPVDGRGLLPDLDGGMFLAAQPNGAHALFPGNDHPSDKATFTLSITAPPGMQAVASGRLVRQEVTADGSLTSTWASAHPVATHVVSLAVGRFTVVWGVTPDGMPLRSAVPTAFATQPEWRLDAIPDAIAWLEDRLGPYPFETFGVLFTPPGAANAILEGQTLALMPASLFDPRRPDCIWRALLVHELAHQWFGDLVSLTRWDEKWLSEGHATFVQERWAADVGCGGRSMQVRMRAAYRAAQAVRDAHGPPGRPFGPADAYTAAIYEGGSLVLYALRQSVGAATFAAIESAYLERHAGGNASTADFIDIAVELGGRSVRPLLEAWLFGPVVPPMPGHPGWVSDGALPSPSP